MISALSASLSPIHDIGGGGGTQSSGRAGQNSLSAPVPYVAHGVAHGAAHGAANRAANRAAHGASEAAT